jgi:hypothetical protein
MRTGLPAWKSVGEQINYMSALTRSLKDEHTRMTVVALLSGWAGHADPF